MSKYVATSRDLEGNLLSNSEFVDSSKSFVTLTQERVQQQQQSSLGREIDSLMEFLLKKYKRRSYMRRRQTVSCMDGWAEEKVKGKLNGVLQTKVWKLGVAKEDNQMYGQQFKGEKGSLHNKVWDLGKTKDKSLLIRRSIIFLPWESDAGASNPNHMVEDLGN